MNRTYFLSRHRNMGRDVCYLCYARLLEHCCPGRERDVLGVGDEKREDLVLVLARIEPCTDDLEVVEGRATVEQQLDDISLQRQSSASHQKLVLTQSGWDAGT